MAIIFTYPVIKAADLASTDRLIISKMNSVGNNPTKSLTLANLANFIGPLIPGLGSVTSVNFKTDGTALNINSNSITTSGTMTGVWQGSSSQYVNGEGDLVTFPTISAGTVTGTGTTNSLPIWTDGPNGVLGDSPIAYDSGTPKVSIAVGTNVYTFGEAAFSSSVATGFDFKSSGVNGGFYKSGNFRFEAKLAVGRSFDPTGATLDVGLSTDTVAAAWFRNGVVISNNPGGVQVDNTSMVIGAGNNDVVTGSDNCLAVGNNNQVLSNSDHSVAFGIGNTLTQSAGASLVVGQGNTIDGTGIPGGSTVRSQVLGLNNNLTGSFASFIAGGSNTVTTEQNAMVLGFGNTTNGVDNVFAIGESNTLNDATANGVFMIGNAITGQDGNMVLGFRNDTSSYPATEYGNGLGNTKLVLSTGTVTNSNAIIITEGGVTRGGGFAQEPRIVMPSIVAFDYADDLTAANQGIPVGGIYHNAGALRIRRT